MTPTINHVADFAFHRSRPWLLSLRLQPFTNYCETTKSKSLCLSTCLLSIIHSVYTLFCDPFHQLCADVNALVLVVLCRRSSTLVKIDLVVKMLILAPFTLNISIKSRWSTFIYTYTSPHILNITLLRIPLLFLARPVLLYLWLA